MDSIELLLDGHSEELIRRDWAILLDAGLPSQARHTGASNRPHITLLAAPAIPDTFDSALSALGHFLAIEATNAGLVVFRSGRRQVLARVVVVSGPLQQVHRSVHEALPSLPGIAANCLPDRWIPHITLARGMSADQIAQALELLPPDHGQVSLAGLRRWNSHEKTTTALASGQQGRHKDEGRHRQD